MPGRYPVEELSLAASGDTYVMHLIGHEEASHMSSLYVKLVVLGFALGSVSANWLRFSPVPGKMKRRDSSTSTQKQKNEFGDRDLEVSEEKHTNWYLIKPGKIHTLKLPRG